MLNRFKIALIALLSMAYCQHSFGWGVEGHKVVALIAEQQLTPEARAGIDIIMHRDANGKISDIASWADKIRGKEPGPQISHVVKIPFKATSYSAKRDCSGKYKCVVYGILKAESELKDGRREDSDPVEQQRALKFLVHYIGDVHQPLHGIQETGGMRTQPSRQKWELHKVWDTIIIRSSKQSPESIAKRLLAKHKTVQQGTPEQWAMESHDIAKRIIYGDNYALAKSRRPISLDKDYYKENMEIVDERLLAAGLRLGNVLNDIFK